MTIRKNFVTVNIAAKPHVREKELIIYVVTAAFHRGHLSALERKRKNEPTFALDLAHKDLRLAMELADELGVPGMIAPQVLNLQRMARGMGLGGMDSSSVIRVYETALNEEVRAK